MGYILPWGQMSFWGATVITNLFSAIPFIGKHIVLWLWGGFSVSEPTLTRFYSLHFLLPFVLAALVCVHIILLHWSGSSAPIYTSTSDYCSFLPYFYFKDFFIFLIFLFMFFFMSFFFPNALGHPDNYIPANPLVTPAHIVPEWYFLPFYAILRSIPNKLGGVFFMFAALITLFFLPLYPSLLFFRRHLHYITAYFSFSLKVWFFFIFFNFCLLGWLGAQPAVEPLITIGLWSTFFYFFLFTFGLSITVWLDNYFFNLVKIVK